MVELGTGNSPSPTPRLSGIYLLFDYESCKQESASIAYPLSAIEIPHFTEHILPHEGCCVTPSALSVHTVFLEARPLQF